MSNGDYWQEGPLLSQRDLIAEVKAEEDKNKDLYNKAGLTRDSFIQMVKEKIENEKQPFIIAVYQTLNSFVEKEKEITGVVLACKKGCAICCSSTFLTCTEMEIDMIIDFINGLPRESRIPLLRKIKSSIRKWQDYYTKNEFLLSINPFQVYQDWQKPCCFLNVEGGYCEIYEVRPIDCRTYTSLTPCYPKMETHAPSTLYWQGVGRFRFQSERWANNLILEEQKMKVGYVAITPILHWLLVKKKELF